MLRLALGTNGALMFVWSFFLFFRHRRIIALGEGRKAAAGKTEFDDMIWRIVGLWVAFVGLSCLFVTDLPGGFWSSWWGFAPNALEVVWRPMAWLLVAMHAIETAVKYKAMGVFYGAYGNILLGGLPLAALLLG